MIYRVNLTTGTITKEDVPGKWKGLGGRALTSTIVAQEVPSLCWPLGEDNKLVLAPGLLGGTGGDLKFKISDVVYELLMEMLASLPARSEGRRLYESIFDGVLKLLREQVQENGPLVTPLLLKQLRQYDRQVKRNPKRKRQPRSQFFRFNAYLALNMRDEKGRRYFRDALVKYVKGDQEFRARFDEEVEALILRMIDGLKLGDNL